MFNIDNLSHEKDENSICEGKDIIKDHDILIKKDVYPFIQYPFYNYKLLNNKKILLSKKFKIYLFLKII